MGKPTPIRLSVPSSGAILRGGAAAQEPLSALRRRGRRAQTVLALRERPQDVPGRCGTARGIRAASADRVPWGKVSHGAEDNNNVILSGGAIAPESKDLAATTQGRGTQLLALVLAALLAVTMLPTAGLQAAYADEPVERPATSGGDVALQSANGAGDATAAPSPVAEEREGSMLAAGGLLYTVADGGLALVGFDGAAAEDGAGAPALEGALSVPAAVSVDGRDVAVVAIDVAEGQAAPGVVALSLPQSVKDIEVETLASAFPSLLSVEVASGQGSSLPVAAGAAAMRATYSSFGGVLLGQATVDVEGDAGSVEAVQCRELLWAPPAAVAVRLPVDCLSIAPGALADARGLETIVCFGDVQRIAAAERDESGNVTVPGALTDGQLETVTVVFPDATPAVPSEGDGRVSASMALNDGATQTDKRHAWVALGLPLERLSMGKPTGALTETVAVTEEGTPAAGEAQLISYPGMHPKATDVKHPGEDGKVDMADNGLAYEMKSDMTLSVRWQGDVTATPSHLEIPATVMIDGVTYPVTEIAPEAFKGAVFLESVTIPEGMIMIGKAAFEGCVNLTEASTPVTVKAVDDTLHGVALSFSSEESRHEDDATGLPSTAGEGSDDGLNLETSFQTADEGGNADSAISPYAVSNTYRIYISNTKMNLGQSDNIITGVTIDQPSGTSATLVAMGGDDFTYDLTVPGYLCYSMSAANGMSTYYGTSGLFYVPDENAYASRTYINIRYTLQPGYRLIGCDYDRPQATSTESQDGFYRLLTSRVLVVKPIIVRDWNYYYTASESDGRYALLSGNATQSWTSSNFYNKTEANNLLNGKAAASHTHDDRYYTESEMNTKLGAKLDSSAVSNYNTNAKLDAKFNTKVDASDFGSITYSGLDGADMSVFPTSYRKGGTPAIPAPERNGFEFAGWSWARGGASGDSSNIANAFSEAGTVALAANWEESAPEANCFFADAALNSATGGAWESVIAVKLTADTSKTSVSGIAFAANDATGLLKKRQDGSLPDVAFAVGSSRDGVSGAYGFGGAPTGSVQLCDVEGGKGIYVKITIPAGGVDADRVVGSLTASDYIASLVRMTYQSLA